MPLAGSGLPSRGGAKAGRGRRHREIGEDFGSRAAASLWEREGVGRVCAGEGYRERRGGLGRTAWPRAAARPREREMWSGSSCVRKLTWPRVYDRPVVYHQFHYEPAVIYFHQQF